MTTLSGITQRHPDIQSGAPVFVGTRVTVRTLFDYLEGGDNLDEFHRQFPSVQRSQTRAVLDAAFERIACMQNALAQKSYKKAIVSFIDILGFSAAIEKKSCQEIEKILRKMKIIKDIEYNNGENPKIIQFSDCIIRIRFYDESIENDFLTCLYHEINLIGILQADAINNGIFLRGGVTQGDVYVEDHIFGPAFVEAYKLESKKANHPKIIIGNEIFDKINSCGGRNSDNEARSVISEAIDYFEENLKKDEDEEHRFIDYIKILSSNHEYNEDFPSFLKKHKKTIIENLELNAENNSVKNKYEWVKNYHNQKIKELQIKDQDLLISTEEHK